VTSAPKSPVAHHRRALALLGASALVLVLIFTVHTASGSSASYAGSVISCGDIPSRLIFGISARRLSCATARRVARQWGSQCAQIRTGSCLTTSHFYCRYRDTAYEAGAIRCVYESDLRRSMTTQRAVRFSTGT
jgi:hypothetical protein